MYKWWIYAVPRWHCVALGCKDSYWTSCMPFSQTLCLYWPLRSVKKTRAKNSFWFHIWFDQFLMLNTQSFCPTNQSFCPTKHSAIPFCVKQLLSSATFDLWSTKLGSKAFANTSGIRHSCHPWFWGLPCTTDFQNNAILKNSDFVVRKTPDICPAMAPIILFILFVPEMHVIFFRNINYLDINRTIWEP